MTSWPVDSKVLKRLDHPHVVSWQTWQIAGCIKTWVFHVWPAIMCWYSLDVTFRCVSLRILRMSSVEAQDFSTTTGDFTFSPEKIHCRWGASIWSWSHVVEGICWSGQMMGLARNGGWEVSYLVSLGVGQGVFVGCWTGCFQVFQLGLFNGSLDCSICSWHIELSMEMTCQIRKLSHSSRSNLQLFHASAWSQQMIQTQHDTYIYIYTHIIYMHYLWTFQIHRRNPLLVGHHGED